LQHRELAGGTDVPEPDASGDADAGGSRRDAVRF